MRLNEFKSFNLLALICFTLFICNLTECARVWKRVKLLPLIFFGVLPSFKIN